MKNKSKKVKEFRKMFTVRDTDSAFSDDADCSYREHVLDKIQQALNEEYSKGFVEGLLKNPSIKKIRKQERERVKIRIPIMLIDDMRKSLREQLKILDGWAERWENSLKNK